MKVTTSVKPVGVPFEQLFPGALYRCVASQVAKDIDDVGFIASGSFVWLRQGCVISPTLDYFSRNQCRFERLPKGEKVVLEQE